MGKLTGFMEFERHEPPGRDPKKRLQDWLSSTTTCPRRR